VDDEAVRDASLEVKLGFLNGRGRSAKLRRSARGWTVS
jgi:hypothetical protein